MYTGGRTSQSRQGPRWVTRIPTTSAPPVTNLSRIFNPPHQVVSPRPAETHRMPAFSPGRPCSQIHYFWGCLLLARATPERGIRTSRSSRRTSTRAGSWARKVRHSPVQTVPVWVVRWWDGSSSRRAKRNRRSVCLNTS